MEEEEEYNDIKNRTFFNKYHCVYRIGKGAFGSVFKAEYNKELFALKFERRDKKNNLLEKEAEIMDYLQGTNIPSIELYSCTEDYNILVMELLGKSLNYYLKKLKYFSIKTVCMIGGQILSILEFIHNRHIVHRDIKPDNFCMGLSYNSKNVYLIDFGLAKKYRNSSTLIHYPLINKKRLTGTPRYASINALKGFEQSRRDDLESLGYVLIYFLRGDLPWQNVLAKTKDERNKKILEKKIEISSSKLCEGFPIQFVKFLNYVKNLQYTEKPDYNMLRNLLNDIMSYNNYKYNYFYDWTTKEEMNKKDNRELCHREENINKKRYNSCRNIYYINKNNINNKYNNVNNRENNISKITNNYVSLTNIFQTDFNYDKEEIMCSSLCTTF